MNKVVRNILRYLGFLILGFFLFWLSFRKLDISLVWEELAKANYYWAALALVLVVISHIFRSLRWNLLINSMGYRTRLSTTFYALMVGYMANTAVPRMGEFMRCGVLSKKENIPFNALFGTVISERLFDLVVLVLLLLAVVLGQWSLLGDFVLQWTGPFIEKISSSIFYLALVIAIFLGLLAGLWMLYVKYKNHLNAIPGYKKIMALLSDLTQGIRTIERLPQKGLFLVYTFLIWLFYVLMMFVPFFMFPDTSELDLLAGITLLAIGSLGIVAPVPGGIGAYHFITKAVLTELYGISGHVAGSFAVITHAAQTLLNVIVGALGYFILFFADHKKPSNEKS